METKRCSRCKEDKSLFDYHKNQNHCKKCKKILNVGFNRNRSNYARLKYPTTGNIGVYAIKENDQVIYVGSSDNLPFRLYKHFRCNNSFVDGKNPLERQRDYRWAVLAYTEHLDDAREIEKIYIRRYSPGYNKILYKNG